MSKALRLSHIGDIAHRFPGSVWWHVRADDAGVEIAIENPRPELDVDDDTGALFAIYEWDSLAIVTGVIDGVHQLRDMTDEESDEYSDDVREFLRASSDVWT